MLTHIGRLAFEKNVDFLLRMLVRVKREIPDVLLVIAGEGPARRRLEAMGVELGLHEQLLFVGYLNRDGDLEDCYRAGDGFVFASRTETQGLVLLEAMALGVPVVSTAVMGTRGRYRCLPGGRWRRCKASQHGQRCPGYRRRYELGRRYRGSGGTAGRGNRLPPKGAST